MACEAAMKKRFLVPEVIQISAMDCGPAALKSLFGGFGVYLSYGRLREACHTDVDGTSLDALEDIAQTLGLDVAQTMMPPDLLLLRTSQCLPAIVAVRLPDGAPHFVVLWRVVGPWVQIMDPASGRLWIKKDRFIDSLFIHEQSVPQTTAQDWTESDSFRSAIYFRMRALGVKELDWDDERHLDATLRLAQALVTAGKLQRGPQARHFLELCKDNPDQIPNEFWCLRKVDLNSEEIQMRGAVLVSASSGKKSAAEEVPEALKAVLNEPPPKVMRIAWSLVLENGLLAPGLITAALVVISLGTVFEAVLFRCLLGIGSHLQLRGQRVFSLAAVLLLLSALMILEWASTSGLMRIGRHLEIRLRMKFLYKIPRLSDRYFQSRLIADMAFRAHTLHLARDLPNLVGQLIRIGATLLWTAAGIAWFYPHAFWQAALAITAALAIPLVFLPQLKERDLRCRELSGGLGRFYLDAALGIRAIQAHGADGALTRLYQGQLGQWNVAGFRKQRLLVRAEVLQLGLIFASLIWLVHSQVANTANSCGVLLLIYWCLAVPALGRQFASIAWNVPGFHNTLVRFLDPLSAPEEEVHESKSGTSRDLSGVEIKMENLSVMEAGHCILHDINFNVAPGQQVGIIGPSGAGKSSLVGLLLGWYVPAEGSLQVDGEALAGSRIGRLRRETAWIDPQVHLFNDSLIQNLFYGSGEAAGRDVDDSIRSAGLIRVLRRLPTGLQTALGDGGTRLSGGEGQQVRIGRGFGRCSVRLAILDEPARSVPRPEREAYLSALRLRFEGATLLCITHDVCATLSFDRVVILDEGTIVEQGHPRELYDQPSSRYRALCDHEKSVNANLWSSASWRRLLMRDGRLTEFAKGSA
jgi:ABC-type bacteriocin/lantibiotic exporter with double-glycine peptidase domain